MKHPVLRTLPSVRRIRWFNIVVLVASPACAIYGLCNVHLHLKTAIFAVFYYVFTMLGITAGYHRLWSHRSYNASLLLKYLLIAAGSSAVQGSCYWWSRRHRSHHRYTDTDLDPYNSQRGLLWTHIGWIIFESEQCPGPADVTDLKNDPILQWQHRNYFLLMSLFGYLIPTVIPGILWSDWNGGFCFAGTLRLTVAHHSTFCINSIAHYLGNHSYDDRLSPRDHLISALLTMGEGYHNFHHQFPSDYRNAYRWYHYDPTKWFIATCKRLGLANNLRVFPSNEIEKGAFSMKLKTLKEVQDSLNWHRRPKELKIITWKTFQEEAQHRPLILIGGFIHDVSDFLNDHPGGRYMLSSNYGMDMTAAFFGGLYTHSDAAHNLLAMMRVGVLAGGMEIFGPEVVPPSERLSIVSAKTIMP